MKTNAKDVVREFPRLNPSDRIFLASAGKKGLGVFARRTISNGELVEECPISPLTPEEERVMEQTMPVICRYLFLWEDQQIESHAALVWGFGSFYNHSKTPNLELSYDFPGRRIKFVATRDVEIEEELTFDYAVPLWFEDSGK